MDPKTMSNSERRKLAREDLIMGMSPSAVAAKYGVHPCTVSGWHTPEVHAEREKRRAEIVAAGRMEIATYAQTAMSALHEVAGDPDQPGPARVAAANSILDRTGIVKTDEITIKTEQSSADDVAAGLLAILGRASRELGRAKGDLSAPAVEADPDEG